MRYGRNICKMTKEELIKQCKFYNGSAYPASDLSGDERKWFQYEKRWVTYAEMEYISFLDFLKEYIPSSMSELGQWGYSPQDSNNIVELQYRQYQNL